MKRLPIVLVTLLLVSKIAAYGQSNSSALNAKQLTRAENLISQLERFETFINSRPDLQEYKKRVEKLTASVSNMVGTLSDGDTKTDIATAIHLYQRAAVDWNNSETSELGESLCANERPGAYQRLCESSSRSPRDLWLTKALLHVGWAKASIAFQRSGEDNAKTLDEIQVERRNDRVLAERALMALKSVESEVIIYNSLGDFEARRTLARVPYETFRKDLRKVAVDVESILRWLPQNRLKTEIGNALHSYQDGAFWWERTYQPRVVNAFALVSQENNRTASDTTYLETVPYTVAINWRHASKYTKRVEEILNRASCGVGL